jgi:hypothetical protein
MGLVCICHVSLIEEVPLVRNATVIIIWRRNTRRINLTERNPVSPSRLMITRSHLNPMNVREWVARMRLIHHMNLKTYREPESISVVCLDNQTVVTQGSCVSGKRP